MEISFSHGPEGDSAFLKQVPVHVSPTDRPGRCEQDPDKFALCFRHSAYAQIKFFIAETTNESTRVVVP